MSKRPSTGALPEAKKRRSYRSIADNSGANLYERSRCRSYPRGVRYNHTRIAYPLHGRRPIVIPRTRNTSTTGPVRSGRDADKTQIWCQVSQIC